MNDTLFSFPLRTHEALTSVLHYLNLGLFLDFRNKANLSNPPHFNILFYIPRLQASIHIMPFQPLNDERCDLPDIEKSIYNIINKRLEAKSRNYQILTDREVKSLFHFALRCPNVRACINELNNNPEKKLFEHLGCVNDSTASMLQLIKVFNENNIKVINELNKADLLQSVLHVMLSVVPQFDHAKHSALDDTPYGWKSYSEKIDKLNALVHDFLEEKEASFADRLFLFLSLIESMQWPVDSSFGYFGNIYSFIESADLPQHNILKENALFFNQIKLYFYGKYSKDPLKQTATNNVVKKVIGDAFIKYSGIIAQLFSTFSFERYNQDLMNFPDLFERPAFAVTQGLLNFIKPQYVLVGKRDIKKRFFLDHDSLVTKFSKMPISKTDLGADELLRTPWATYASRDIYQFGRADERSQEKDEELDLLIHLVPENINRSISPSLDKTSIFIDLKELLDVDKGIIVKFENKQDAMSIEESSSTFVELLRRIASATNHIALDSSAKDWYKKAFSPLYETFDTIRQERKEFTVRKKHEAAFIIDQLRSVTNRDDAVVVDLGIGYGRVAEILLKENKKLNIIGVDQSEALTNIFTNKLSAEDRKRLTIENIDFSDMELLDQYKESADLVIMMFTTFGCFDSDEENKATLLHAFELLKTGGLLIIEQYNPEFKTDFVVNFEVYPENDEERDKLLGNKLIKTSEYKKEEDYCQYSGNYFYFRSNGISNKLIKCDDYRLKLYTRDWFVKQARQMPNDGVEFYGDFNMVDGKYEEYNAQKSPLLICTIKKKYDFLSDKDAVEKAKMFLKLMQAGMNDYRFNKGTFSSTSFRSDDQRNLLKVYKKGLIALLPELEEADTVDKFMTIFEKVKNVWNES